MKNENENGNMKEDVLERAMFSRLIGYGIIVFLAKGILIMSDRIPTLNVLINKINSTDAIYYTLSVMLLLEVITYLTYNSFMKIKRKRVKKELDLIVKGYSKGFHAGCKYQSRQGDNHD